MIIWMVVAFVFILGPLMFLHELGHFWAAKKFGIPVEEFGFGLGPKLVTLFKRGGTEYTIRAIPFAAFVRVAGEEDAGLVDGLTNAPRKARFVIAAAGPAMNIAAVLALFWIAYLFGPPAYTHVAIEGVASGSPAASAGIQVDDLILQMDGVEISATGELAEYTSAHLGQQITLLVERGGREMEIELTPRTEGEYDSQVEGPIGIRMYTEAGPPDPQNVFQAGGSAVKEFGEHIEEIIHFPGMLARAWKASAERGDSETPIPPEEDLRNFRPVGIYAILQLIALTLQTGILGGYWIFVFQMAGFFSMALGITNLLPLPALDGGRMLFAVLDWLSEKLLRRNINPEREILVHAIGMVVLLLLMAVITWQDIVNPIPLLQFPTPTPGP